MNFQRGDFRKIGTALGAQLLLIALGSFLAWWAHSAARATHEEFASVRNRAEDITGRLVRLRLAKDDILRSTPRFLSIAGDGTGNEARRLEWIERLKSICDKRQLIEMHYEFQTPRALENEPAGAPSWRVSPMHVRLDILHEEDLIGFLQDLYTQAAVLTRIRSCRLTRSPAPPDRPASGGPLHAECLIDWISIGEWPSGK